jgi:amino acid permease
MSYEEKKDDLQASTTVTSPADAQQIVFDAEKGIVPTAGVHRTLLIDGAGKSTSDFRSCIPADGAVNDKEGAVIRSLKQRHMAMIALGGAIGTGK